MRFVKLWYLTFWRFRWQAHLLLWTQRVRKGTCTSGSPSQKWGTLLQATWSSLRPFFSPDPAQPSPFDCCRMQASCLTTRKYYRLQRKILCPAGKTVITSIVYNLATLCRKKLGEVIGEVMLFFADMKSNFISDQQPERKRKSAADETHQQHQLWGEAETFVLIDIWKDRLADLWRQKRNSVVYEGLRQAASKDPATKCTPRLKILVTNTGSTSYNELWLYYTFNIFVFIIR